MKKVLSVVLALILCFSCVSILSAGAAEVGSGVGAPDAMKKKAALYVHAVMNSEDTEAWQAWQSIHDLYMSSTESNEKYFFLPSSADDSNVDIYNGFSTAVTVNGVSIKSGETKSVAYQTNKTYNVTAGGTAYTLRYMKSGAEAAIYVNSTESFSGSDLITYLNSSKSNSAAATGAIVDQSGKIDNTGIKKIKGRGNTTWDKSKKPYNITYNSKVSIAGMAKNKKYSLLANFQDDSLSRNRFLYDLSDAVGMPYASDSRYVDFYVNGYYWGSYQMTEKVEAGSLVTDVDEEDYLNEDGTIKSDFSFIAEIDASASSDDYYFTSSLGVKVTIKAPEIDPGMPGYDEVKAYVKEKFDKLLTTARNVRSNLSTVADVDSLTKLYLINELGKNWDSGVSSTFLTYKPDENGVYKFYGSPVWDYDNSLGNAVGVSGDLSSIGVTDYTKYTGWWCRYKSLPTNQRATTNLVTNLANHRDILAEAPRIWFEEFMPAIRHFSGETKNAIVNPDLYSAADYYSLIKSSAEMNYTSGWLLNTGSWIADHSSLQLASYDYYTNKYSVAATKSRYSSNFQGMFNYARDWMISRAAWLSNEMYADYKGTIVKYDANRNGSVDINDATTLQRYLAEYNDLTSLQYELGDVDGNGDVTINDVTYIQMIVAEYDLSDIFGSNPEPTDPTDPTVPDGYVKVTFTDKLGWGDTIGIYYYNLTIGKSSTGWPGEMMEREGDHFTYLVPDWAEVVIFNNGVGTLQTENIPFDGKSHNYYAINQKNPTNGRYYYGVD